jgi:hypothetical protein
MSRVVLVAILVPAIVLMTIGTYLFALHARPSPSPRARIQIQPSATMLTTTTTNASVPAVTVDPLMERLLYWRKWPAVPRSYVDVLQDRADAALSGDASPSKRFFVFQTWQGGFNNERMSYELAVLTSFLTRRTLVLPPPYPLYLLDSSSLEDYFDIEALRAAGLDVITFAEFLADVLALDAKQRPSEAFVHHHHKIWETLQAHPRVTTVSEFAVAGDDNGQMCWVYPTYPSTPEALERAKGWCLHNARIYGVLDNARLMEPDIVFVPTRKLFDHYYSHFFFTDAALGRETMAMMRQAVHLVQPAFEWAARVLRQLPPSFNAIHVRRNDFQYKDIRHIPVATIIQNTRAALPPDEPLYIATDEKDPAFLREWRDLYTAERIFSLEANFTATLAKAPKRWLGLIEMIVASQAKMFVGSRLSTFSGYITRLRGYMNATYQETHFTTDSSDAWLELERDKGLEGYRPSDRLPLWAKEWSWATWGREFKEAWDANLQLYAPRNADPKD